MIPISDSPGPRHSFPFVTLLLIAANIFVFLVFELGQPSERALSAFIRSAGVVPQELASGRDIAPFSPFAGVYGTLLTSMFLHGGWLHLGSNMLYLWVFGDNVEDALGKLPYLVFYLVCGIVGGLSHVLFNLASNVASIGASGAIAGVLAGYLALFPHAQIRTLVFLGPFILLPRLSALFLIGFWFITQLFSGLAAIELESNQSTGVAFWAHIGGFIAGFLLVRVMPAARRR